ncbi:hypothetical protein GCM10011348_39170 [Marinobacterium nitratireducens]|uniref:LssY-like C-terminal domain-containing protein n=1 Tax=Marinobacterium nitratireducens TaxID=518897 RepID=A0A917ZPL0_9GAMM|nr:LssY C-terminal domain-containing protein [Marinobacterium nitratireducens]GGO87001.1 hypothetical protein GCM10011348_39170 [Marinobacterium nitratireducens]
MLGGCSSYAPNPGETGYLTRVQSQVQGNVRVETAVLSRAESRRVFGVDLGLSQIQPVWISIENRDPHPYWLISSALDPEYFSPHEVAYSQRRWLRKNFNDALEAYFASTSFFNPIPAESTHSGFIFVNLDEDEKELDVDLISRHETKFFDFYVELSGLKAHSLTRAESLVPESDKVDLDEAGLKEVLQSLPCCTRGQHGEVNGDPLNLVIIGDASQLFPPFVRRGWHYSEESYLGSVWKTINSFLFGKHYRYSPVSSLYFRGRKQDIALQKARGTIHQRNHLRLWITDYRYNGKDVWIGQISRDIGVRFTLRSPTLTTHKIDPDIDETRTAFIEDMLFSQGLSRIGFIEGVGARSPSAPGENLTGDPYYTDGLRAVLEFDSRPNNIEDVRFFDWASPPKRKVYVD